jgi:hypothetical protein
MGGGRVSAKVAAVLLGIAVVASACSSGTSNTGGLRREPPTPSQEAAIARYASQNLALNLGAGDGDTKSKVGCAFSPMATKPLSGKGLIVYGHALCQTCPPADTGAVLPVVARLDSNVVLSEQTTHALSDPDFQTQIDKIFPRSLWAKASAQDLPNADALLTSAHEEAGCS